MMTRVRLKRLWMIVAMIVMATNCFAEGEGQEIKMNDKQNLYFQVIDGEKKYVVARATPETTGDVTVPYEVHDAATGTFTYYVKRVERFSNPNITSVILTENIEIIEKDCFFDCKALKSVTVPSTVTTIGGGAFANCPNMQEVSVSEGNPNFAVKNKVLYNKDFTQLLYYPIARPDKEIELPAQLKKVEASAFAGALNLKKIKLSKHLTDFDATAIKDCKNLEEFALLDGEDGPEKYKDTEDGYDGKYCVVDGMLVCYRGRLDAVPYNNKNAIGKFTPPTDIVSIGPNAFFNCTQLTEVDLIGLDQLYQNAFYRCNNLKTVHIPQKLTKINTKAFYESTALKNFTVDENNTAFMEKDGILFTKDGKTLFKCPISHFYNDVTKEYKTYTIPDGVETIGEDAFHYCKIKEVTIPSDVKTIGKHAFSYSELEKVSLNEGLEYINENAFQDARLSEVTIPASVKTIGTSAFYRNVATREENGVKIQVPGLTSVTIEDGSQLTDIKASAFGKNPFLKSFTFGGSCTLETIGEAAFADCPVLEKFTVPASVKNIQKGAFNNCIGLETISFAENPTATELTLGTQVFQNCDNLKHVTLPANLKKIPEEAFNDCEKLTQVDIPTVTNEVHHTAFKFCRSLVNINVLEPNTTFTTVDGMLASDDMLTLLIFPAGKANDKITLLSPSFTKIGTYAFYSCDKLKNVTIPKQVKEIESRAFSICDNLNTIAFLGDNPIEKDKIGADAFLGTGNTDILAKCKLSVRKGKEGAYAAAELWKDYSKNIITSFKREHKDFTYTDEETNEEITEYEEYFPMSDNAVSLLEAKSSAYTLVIPAKVTTKIGDEEKTYDVSMIGDYAFEGAPKAIKEVVIEGDIIYIGSWAFRKAKHSETIGDVMNVDKDKVGPIENIFFVGKNQAETELSTERFGLDDEKFGGVYNEFWIDESKDGFKQNIYVRKSVYNQVKEDGEESTWGQWADDLQYKIKLPFELANKPGEAKGNVYLMPFSREFAVDLTGDDDDNWDTEKASPKVIAFTSGEYRKGKEEETNTDRYYVYMQSINNTQDGVKGNGNGTWIPKNTGVVLREVNKQTPEDFYYTIYDGEEELTEPTNNLMVAVTERDGIMLGNDNYYVFGFGTDNKIHRYTGSNGRPVSIHQGYLQLSKKEYDAVNPANPNAVKLYMVFDNNETTGIEDVKTDVNADNDAYYTLQGIKVARPTQGIYIHNGKKVVVK